MCALRQSLLALFLLPLHRHGVVGNATQSAPPTLNGTSSERRSFVSNFVKFEWRYDHELGKAQLEPVGCVPTNRDDGELVPPGMIVVEHDFEFLCEEEENGIISYEAIACVDPLGERMRVGDLRRISNGTVILHCRHERGVLRKIVEKQSGCESSDGQFYEQDDRWTEPVRDEHLPDLPSSVQLTARLLQCFRPHFSHFEAYVVGCVWKNTSVEIDDFAELPEKSGRFVQCVSTQPNQLQFAPVSASHVRCKLDDTWRAHGDEWIDEERAAKFRCKLGRITKLGCVLRNLNDVPLGQELSIDNGCTFLCHPQTNVYICNKRLADFSVVEPPVDEPPESGPRRRVIGSGNRRVRPKTTTTTTTTTAKTTTTIRKKVV